MDHSCTNPGEKEREKTEYCQLSSEHIGHDVTEETQLLLVSAPGYANTKSSSLLPIYVPGMVIFFVCVGRERKKYVDNL